LKRLDSRFHGNDRKTNLRTFYDFINIDDLVKSLKRRITVIPANPGSGPGQAPESSYFKYLKILWTPVSTGVTTFYEIINIQFL
jgi:hypothetical protein